LIPNSQVDIPYYGGVQGETRATTRGYFLTRAGRKRPKGTGGVGSTNPNRENSPC